jgi:AraC family transcriptional regulator
MIKGSVIDMTENRLSAGEFYGNSRMCQAFSGFKVIEVTYAPNERAPRHTHQCACFSFMLGGAMVENYRSRKLELTPRVVSFNATDEPHYNTTFEDGARFLVLEIDSSLTDSMNRRRLSFGKSAVFRGGDPWWLGLKLYREWLQNDLVSQMAIEGLGLEIIASLFRLTQQRDPIEQPRWFAQARNLIHSRFSESFSIADIANFVDVHPVHLTRTFRKYQGCSVGEYVRRLRIEKAQHDISSSSYSLAEIAQRTGFCDQGHLTRVFKRLTGLTPAKYRESL